LVVEYLGVNYAREWGSQWGIKQAVACYLVDRDSEPLVTNSSLDRFAVESKFGCISMDFSLGT